MGWLGRGIGDFGSQVGQGYGIAQDWRQQQQSMAIENARQKLAALMGPLQLQELQQKIKQMGQPQQAGVERNPTTGSLSGVTWNPTTGKYELQPLAAGSAPQQKITTPFEAFMAKNPNASLQDWFNLSRPQKPDEPKDPFEVWRAQNPNASVSDWLKLQEKYKKQPADPNAIYDRWEKEQKYKDANKDDSTSAVKNVLNAQKSLQQLELNIQKTNRQFSIWNPGTWGKDPTLQALAQRSLDDFNAKKQDAIEALTEEGKPIPTWLSGPQQQQGGAPPPPPGGFTLDKK